MHHVEAMHLRWRFILTHSISSKLHRENKISFNGKATNATLIISELLKWTRSYARDWIMVVIGQAIKQGFLNDWLMNSRLS